MSYQDTPCPNSAKTASHTTYKPFAKPSPATSGITWDDEAQEPTSAQKVATSQPNDVPAPSVQGSATTETTTCAGIGCSQHARGQTVATQCTAPDGRVYYTTKSCTTRMNYVGTTTRGWQRDTVQGHPDAVMINRDEALDPQTGRIMQLDAAPVTTPVYQRARDAGQQINSDAACQGARNDAHMHPRDAKAAKRAREVCSAGRGLWDQAPPDRGIQ
jgi:hypothetical protein